MKLLYSGLRRTAPVPGAESSGFAGAQGPVERLCTTYIVAPGTGAVRGALIRAAVLLFVIPAFSADDPAHKATEIAKLSHSSPVDFEREVLPIIKANCLACHNKTTTKADLILETPETMIKGGESGRGLSPKHGADSLILKVAAKQKKPYMPPRDNKVAAKDLTPEELGILKLWIDQGAKGVVHNAAPIEWQSLPEGLNPIYAVALSPDGQFAACGRANQIFIYHVPSGQLVTRLTDPSLLKGTPGGKPGIAHRDLVHSLAFSADGTLLASGGFREVKIWRRPVNAQKFSFANAGHKSVDVVAASPDGAWLATGGDDGAIKLWNLATGKSGRTLSGHKDAITGLAFSADGTKLVSVAKDKTMRLWKLPEGKPFGESAFDSQVGAVIFLPDGKRVATGGGDKIIRIWQLPDSPKGNFAPVKELKGHEGAIASLAAIAQSPDQILSGGTDGMVKLWDIEKAEVVREAKHGAPVASVAMRPDGKKFASASMDNTARLWEFATAKQVAEMKGDRYTTELVAERERLGVQATNDVSYRKSVITSTETNLTAAAERVKTATATNAPAVKEFEEKTKSVAAATEAKAAAEKAMTEFEPVKKAGEAFDAADKAAKQAEADAKAAKEKGDKSQAEKLAADASEKSKKAAELKAAFDKLAEPLKDRRKQAEDKLASTAKALTDAEEALKKAATTKSQTEHELELATSANQKATQALEDAKAAADAAEKARQKAADALQAAKTSLGDSDKPIRAVAFSPDNLTLATAGDDQRIHTWSAESGAAFEVLKGSKSAITALAFAGNDRLASGAGDRAATVWSLNPDWILERSIGNGENAALLADRVNALRFTADGQTLATGGGEPTRGGEIKLWNVATGKLATELKGIHSDAVFALDFSPDEKYLASGAADKFLKVTDLATGKVAKSFEGHTHHVLGVSWKRDGRTLVSSGGDNVVKIWDFISGERKKNVEGFGKEVTAVSFVSTTDQAVACAGDSSIRLFKEDGGNVRNFAGASDYVFSVSVSLDGRIVAAGGQDSTLRIWRVSDGQSVATFPTPPPAKPAVVSVVKAK